MWACVVLLSLLCFLRYYSSSCGVGGLTKSDSTQSIAWGVPIVEAHEMARASVVQGSVFGAKYDPRLTSIFDLLVLEAFSKLSQ